MRSEKAKGKTKKEKRKFFYKTPCQPKRKVVTYVVSGTIPKMDKHFGN